MKKQKNMRIWFWPAVLAVLAWMGVIFSFSAQKDTQSAEVSGRVSYRIVEGVNEAFHLEMTEEEIKVRAKKIDFPVRKGAHMSEYAILALLVLLAAYLRGGSGEKRRLRCYGIALGTAALYAVTDEIHQRFVPGRAGRAVDVLIDTCGAALGLLLVFLLVNGYNHYRNKRKKG